MFNRVLIANRGEIACRVIRTCKRLGIETAAVYSDADAGALHVTLADQAYRIGPAPARESYLNGTAIVQAAEKAGAEALHPGYGFLSENAAFSEACTTAGFVFIGPLADAIRLMGSKSDAKRLMAQHGIPVIPGYHGEAQDNATLAREAVKLGFPLLVKAAAGGGGKGMRLVQSAAELKSAVESARREALASFGDDRLLLEKYILRPRHVELQVFADRHGNTLHLFERDCSLQRRYQKLIEEAPAPGLDETLRANLAKAAVAAARAAAYVGAGTVEFIVDENGGFYFMEMNTRLQVEHPVTEAITGLDLVEWQLRVAAGEPLPLVQSEIRRHDHAVEARVYAESPVRDFMPSAGRLVLLRMPEEDACVRVECGVRQGEAIGVYYDPLIAKIIVTGEDRATAIAGLHKALSETRIAGVESNRDFLLTVTAHPEYRERACDTGFIKRHHDELLPRSGPMPDRIPVLASLYLMLQRRTEAQEMARRSPDPYSPWHQTDAWWLNLENYLSFCFRIGDAITEIKVYPRGDRCTVRVPEGEMAASAELDGNGDLVAWLDDRRIQASVVAVEKTLTVITKEATWLLNLHNPLPVEESDQTGQGRVLAPLPGRITEIAVAEGNAVSKGDRLLILEAMKLEYPVTAPVDGTVTRLRVAAGQQVSEGDVLLVVEHEPS
ncbi:MAG: biotin carboxylase N-terminal domain-containing protein [Pseudomonadota bacterium]